MNKLLIATNNQKKLTEMSQILCELGFICVTLKDIELDIDPEETGTSFEVNAAIKATCAMEASGLPAIADDSGLCCRALEGAPGIYSARYCEGSDGDRTAYLLKNMENETDRAAYFVSAICCVFPNGDKVEGYGRCHGQIAAQSSGDGGFGYDPIFYLPQYKATFSQLDGQLKNKISHRAVALADFKQKMTQYIKAQQWTTEKK